MSTAPRFKKFVKSITIANGGSGYYSGGQVFVPEDDSAYALQYFAEEYVYNSATVVPVVLNTLKLVIPQPTSQILGDVHVGATGTVTLGTNSSVEIVTITESGDGYVEPPVPYIAGTPTAVLNTSPVDPTRDAGTYNDIPTSTDGLGAGLLVSIVVDNTGAVSSIIPKGGDWYGEGEVCTVDPIAIGGTGSEEPISFIITHVNGGTGARFTSEIDIVQKESEYYVEKLSPLIEHQIPEFIANEYPTLVKFLEKYYEFNESNTTEFGIGPDNILHTFVDRHDLSFKHNTEETTTDFLDRFFREYGKDFPVSMEADEELLLKNLRDFYTAKGSAKAVEALFRIMYNEEVEVFVPNQYVLRPSDNVWKREYVIKAYENIFLSYVGESFDPADLEGKLVTLHYYESNGSVTTRKSIDASVLQVKTLAYTSPKAYEITLDINPTFDIPSSGTGATFSASVAGTVGTIENISPADPLRVPGTYTVTDVDYGTSGDGHGAVFQVDVDALGQPTIIATTYGDDFAVGETITILDSALGGGGAADVTFDIATIALGKISNIEILTPGVQYGANPVLTVIPDEADTITTVAQPTTRITDGAVTSVVFEDDIQGVGYNHVPEIRVNSYATVSFLSLRGEDGTSPAHRKVIPSRILKAARPWNTSGAPDGGFKVGQVFPVQETASLAVYAIDYFAQDYTLTGLSNNAFVRVTQVDENNYPKTFEIVAVGIGFQNAVFLSTLTSNTGETATIVGITGFNAVYPGMFQSTSGFLSDANKLHDNRIYQAFSYQVRSERPKSEWGDYVNRAAHPSGMIAYSDLQIRNVIDFAATASIDTDLFFFVVMPDIEEVITSEFVAKDVHLPWPSDSFDTQDVINSKDVTTPKYDTYDAGDAIDKLDVTLAKADTFTTSDVRNKNDIEKNLTVFAAGIYATDYFLEDYTFSADEGLDMFYASDVINAFNLTTSYSDSIETQDAIDDKDIRINGATDSVIFEDTDSSYAEDYFAEDYVSGVPLREMVFEKFLTVVIYGEYAIDYFAEDYTDVVSFESIANNEGEFVRVADSISLGFEPPPLSDTFETSDTAIITLIINRTVTDTFATSDSINLINMYLSKAEIVNTADEVTFDIAKAVADTILTSDAVNIKSIGTYHLDTPVFSDNVIRISAINKTDSTDFSETGTITSQDFGDVDYFLEDYVANEVRYIV